MKYRTLILVNKHPIGGEIELTDAEAKRLLESGAIEPIVKPFSRQFKQTALHTDNLEN